MKIVQSGGECGDGECGDGECEWQPGEERRNIMVAEWPMFTYLHFTSSSSCVRHTSSHATTTNTLDVTPKLSKPFDFLFHYSQHIGPQHLFESGNLFQGSKCSQRLYLIIFIEWYIIVHYFDNKNQSCGGTKCLVMSSNEGLEVRSHLFLSGLLAAINTSHFSLHCHVFTALTNTPGPLDTCQRSQNIQYWMQ